MPRKPATTTADSPIARLRWLHGLPVDANPFEYPAVLHDIAFGQRLPESCPMLASVPAGAEMTRLREAAGIPRERLMQALVMEPGVFAAWEQEQHLPGDSTMVREVGTIGIRVLFGLLAAYIEEQGG